MRPEFFGLRAIEPKRVPTLREQLAGQVIPIKLARFRIGCVVDVRVGNVQCFSVMTLKFSDLVSNRPQTESMAWTFSSWRRFEFARDIRKLVSEDRIALCLPPEPVLHDRIERDLFFAIALRDSEYLVLRDVPILRLKESISPLGKQGRVSGEVAVFDG